MEQAKIKRVKKEVPKFSEEDIKWDKYKKKPIPVNFPVAINLPNPYKQYDTWEELRKVLLNSLDDSVANTIGRMGEITDVKIQYQYGSLLITAKRLETEQEFKKRVIQEAHYIWQVKENQRKNRESIKQNDLKEYNRIKVKYKL